MATSTLTQEVEIVIYREGNIYLYGRWRNGTKVHEQVVPASEARRIIGLHPQGSTPTGASPDFAHSPRWWRWSVKLHEAAV